MTFSREHARTGLTDPNLNFDHAVHAEGQNRIHHILRAFDLDPSYGPNLGMSRLERWQRAKNLGEDPPDEVLDILMTKEGQLLDEYRESCLTVMGV